jgi:hypothetical protein
MSKFTLKLKGVTTWNSKSLQKSIASELQLLKKESAKLEKAEFACEPMLSSLGSIF